MTAIYGGHLTTKWKNFSLFYPSITQAIVDSHYEIMRANNSGECLGRHPITYYGAEVDISAKQAILSRKRLRSSMIVLWIKNCMDTDAEHNLRVFRTDYTLNKQYDGAAIVLSF